MEDYVSDQSRRVFGNADMSRKMPFMDKQYLASDHKFIQDIRRMIYSMLYERTAISGKPEAFNRHEIKSLCHYSP